MENTNLNAKTVIAIPTYNERENLEWIIGEVLAQAPGIHILIVDDNSPDGTGQLADALAADRPQLHVLHRAGGKIVEVPITFVERRAGTSKMSGSIIKEAFLEVVKWRIRELRNLA